MKYLLDTADLAMIRHCNEFYPLAGVTTNPSIIAKCNVDFWEIVCGIREIIGERKMLHIQTTQSEAAKIVEEAELIRRRVGGEILIKIPICEEGLKAAMLLADRGIPVTMTAIFTPAQALVAAKAGAAYVAPYVNRLDNITGDGTRVVSEIVEEFARYDVKTNVLAASFKNAEQVHRCAMCGCHSVTVTGDILQTLISHPMTDAAVAGFDRDWRGVYGERTILDFA